MKGLIRRSGLVINNFIITYCPHTPKNHSQKVSKRPIPFNKHIGPLKSSEKIYKMGKQRKKEIQTMRQPLPNMNAKWTPKEHMINRLFINPTQSANTRPLPTPFLEIIPIQDCAIDNQPYESPNLQKCLNTLDDLGIWAAKPAFFQPLIGLLGSQTQIGQSKFS